MILIGGKKDPLQKEPGKSVEALGSVMKLEDGGWPEGHRGRGERRLMR